MGFGGGGNRRLALANKIFIRRMIISQNTPETVTSCGGALRHGGWGGRGRRFRNVRGLPGLADHRHRPLLPRRRGSREAARGACAHARPSPRGSWQGCGAPGWRPSLTRSREGRDAVRGWPRAAAGPTQTRAAVPSTLTLCRRAQSECCLRSNALTLWLALAALSAISRRHAQELGYRGSGETLKRDEFEERK